MPYIDPKMRAAIDQFNLPYAFDAGTLNYLITKLIKVYLTNNPNYERFNSAMGVLDCVGKEVYRRMVEPYEDKKIEENGDVF